MIKTISEKTNLTCIYIQEAKLGKCDVDKINKNQNDHEFQTRQQRVNRTATIFSLELSASNETEKKQKQATEKPAFKFTSNNESV